MFDPGDVVVLNFPGVQGVKRRPAVVLCTRLYQQNRPDLIVGLITTQTGGAVGPTDCLISDWAVAGLRSPSAFRAFLATVPPSAAASCIGHLSNADWQAVRACLRLALADSL